MGRRVPGRRVADSKFPSGTVARPSGPPARRCCPTPLRGDAARPARAVRLDTPADLERATATTPRRTSSTEELRLGYVALTRARHLLVVSSYLLEPAAQDAARPVAVPAHPARRRWPRWGEEPELWRDKPEKGDAEPAARRCRPGVPWPMEAHAGELERRLRAAELVRRPPRPGGRRGRPADEALDMVEAARVSEWDDELERLLVGGPGRPAPRTSTVPLPVQPVRDGAGPAARRPGPASPPSWPGRCRASRRRRRGSAPGSTPGSRPASASRRCSTPTSCPAAATSEIDDDDDLRELIGLFESGPFADRTPVAVEPPFALVLAGQVVRGRIDAVYAEPDRRQDWLLVVDWKTNRAQTADPLQLAIYRLAWAELAGVPVDRVRAAFYYVRTGDLVEPSGLAEREALERLLRRGSAAAIDRVKTAAPPGAAWHRAGRRECDAG